MKRPSRFVSGKACQLQIRESEQVSHQAVCRARLVTCERCGIPASQLVARLLVRLDAPTDRVRNPIEQVLSALDRPTDRGGLCEVGFEPFIVRGRSLPLFRLADGLATVLASSTRRIPDSVPQVLVEPLLCYPAVFCA
jgi:hypothetical protein